MKKVILFLSVLFLVACTNEEVTYDGVPLNIAVIGDIPELKNENIHFELFSLEKLSEDTSNIPSNFNAIMITPSAFEEASDDKFVEVYKGLETPIIFFDSNKRHFPFVNEELTYETANFDALDNGSHTTIYINNVNINKEDAWYYYLDDENDVDVLYTDIFKKIAEL
ncbi:amino acid oxidase [Lysinibacillus sp. BW-2-10]|uniref:amino acid oxidase n=1 Tax=Lysinibacillus sp. BW-2-10 TaxID=2590030 RepID=UPI00117DD2D7|nr:amino acid oxidase [Lysinibacillus sp. BW-2-10]TSI02543.1 amino acid oxidase [Lysinibacillus sp. BW-2-10]